MGTIKDYGHRVNSLTNEQRRKISIAAIDGAKSVHAARLELTAALLNARKSAIARR